MAICGVAAMSYVEIYSSSKEKVNELFLTNIEALAALEVEVAHSSHCVDDIDGYRQY